MAKLRNNLCCRLRAWKFSYDTSLDYGQRYERSRTINALLTVTWWLHSCPLRSGSSFLKKKLKNIRKTIINKANVNRLQVSL